MHTCDPGASVNRKTTHKSSSARLHRLLVTIAILATVLVSQTVQASGAVRNQAAVVPAQIPTDGFGSKLIVDSFDKLMRGDLPTCGENGDPAGTYTMDLGFRADSPEAIRRGFASMIKFEMRENANGESAGYLYLDVKPRLTFDIDASSCLYEKTFEVRSKSFPVTVLIFGVPTALDVNIGISLDLSLNVDAPLTMRASIGGGIQRGILVRDGRVFPCGKTSTFGCEARQGSVANEFDRVTGQTKVVQYQPIHQPRADRPELALTIEEGLEMAPASKVSFTAQLRLETQFIINRIAGPAMYGRAGLRADIVACPDPKIDQRAYQLSRIWGGGVKAVASETATKLYEELQKANPWLTRLIASARAVVKASFEEFLPSLEYDWPGEDALLLQASPEFQWPLVSCAATPPKFVAPPEVKPPAAKPPAAKPPVVKPPAAPATPAKPPITPGGTPGSPTSVNPAPNTPPVAPVNDTIAGCADDETGALRLRTSVSQSCGATSSTVVWHVARRTAVPTGRSAQRLQVCVGPGGILSVPTGVFSAVSVLTCPSGSPARLWTLVGAARQEPFQTGTELVCASTIQMRIADTCAPSETTLRFNTDGPRAV
jgi:hypothetical protein